MFVCLGLGRQDSQGCSNPLDISYRDFNPIIRDRLCALMEDFPSLEAQEIAEFFGAGKFIRECRGHANFL